MLSNKIKRAIGACCSMRDLRDSFEAECGESVTENVYAMHYLFLSCCEDIAKTNGVQAQTVFRQLTTKLGVDEDTLCEMMLEFLELEDTDRNNARFAVLMRENMTMGDSREELNLWMKSI